MPGSIRFLIAVLALVLLFAGSTLIPPSNNAAVASEDDGAWFRAPVVPQNIGVWSIPHLPDGRIVVSFGTPLIYDPETGTWQEGARHDDIGTPGWAPERAITLDDGRVLVVAGVVSGGSPGTYSAARRAALYDPDSDEWIEAASLHESRAQPSVSRLPDGSILVVGGYYGRGLELGSKQSVRGSVERYYPAEDRWELVGELHGERRNHTATVLPNGRVLVIGGAGPGIQSVRQPTAEVFDPATNTWEMVAEVSDTLIGHAVTLLDDGRVLITGGTIPLDHWEADTGSGAPVASAWLLDPDTGQFDEIPSMAQPRARHTATRLPSGRVLVAGGSSEPSFKGHTATAEIFDPQSGAWRSITPMTKTRVLHQAVALDARAQGAAVYIVGGYEDGDPAVNPEVFYESAPGPVDRQPPPIEPHSDHRYFPVTGHYLSYGFKAFWERHGSLPIFGFPLTEEFDERKPQTGDMHTVQYLERQRFEYHPEHAGTPYEVQLGHLGVADAAQRVMLGSEPFQRLPEDTASDAGCDFFPETGHRLCHGFQGYWEAHGLDFGDPDVSFRESLALFGYPISEEFTDLETGLTVQYFERARFEHHPDNPEPYTVLLGRLGADLLKDGDW